jgi:hypothetical protein
VLKQVKNTVVGVALIFTIGLHWPLLQSVAWVNMIVVFSKHEGIGQAVEKTFNGKNPCKLCNFVAEGKKADQKKTAPNLVKKFDLFSVPTPTVFLQRTTFASYPHLHLLSHLRFYSPLRPPPDLA